MESMQMYEDLLPADESPNIEENGHSIEAFLCSIPQAEVIAWKYLVLLISESGSDPKQM